MRIYFFAWTQRDGGIKDNEKTFQKPQLPGERHETGRLEDQRVKGRKGKEKKKSSEEDNWSQSLLVLSVRALACSHCVTQHTHTPSFFLMPTHNCTWSAPSPFYCPFIDLIFSFTMLCCAASSGSVAIPAHSLPSWSFSPRETLRGSSADVGLIRWYEAGSREEIPYGVNLCFYLFLPLLTIPTFAATLNLHCASAKCAVL